MTLESTLVAAASALRVHVTVLSHNRSQFDVQMVLSGFPDCSHVNGIPCASLLHVTLESLVAAAFALRVHVMVSHNRLQIDAEKF